MCSSVFYSKQPTCWGPGALIYVSEETSAKKGSWSVMEPEFTHIFSLYQALYNSFIHSFTHSKTSIGHHLCSNHCDHGARQNCTYQKCVVVNDGLNENYPDLETQGEQQQDHLSLLIIHSVFHTSQKRCRW